MLTLLLGSDSLAKQQHILAAAKQRGADIQTITETSTIPALGELFEPQLFGPQKIVVFEGVWKNLDPVELLEKVGSRKDALAIVVEDSLDKRKKVNQEFINDKRVQVVQLDAPVGVQAANEWIQKYAKEQGIKIDSRASLALAQALVIEEAVLNVARAQNELEKLKQFAAGEQITAEAVEQLVEKETSVDVFALLNAIATKNKKFALGQLEDYFATETGDEKANAIKVSALLADQFRSLLIAIDAQERRLPDAKVLEMTGWKSGRLFVMNKLARNFQASKIKQTLVKLENLDRELKSSTMPPHVVLDLIIADI